MLAAATSGEVHFLALMRGQETAGLLPLLVVDEGPVRVAYAPYARIWSRPCVILSPGEQLRDWLRPIAAAARAFGADLLSVYTPDALPCDRVKRMQTTEIDLTGAEGRDLTRVPKRQRANVRAAQRAGIEIVSRTGDEACEGFWTLYSVSRVVRFPRRAHSRSYFQRLCALPNVVLLEARLAGQAVAGTIMAWDHRAACYLHNASLSAAKQTKANHLLFWEAVGLGYRLGLVAFDVGGLPPGASNYFKTGWGRARLLEFDWYVHPLTARGRAGAVALRAFVHTERLLSSPVNG